MATLQSILGRLRKPRDTGPGWYKSFANGLQKHYDCDCLEVKYGPR